MTIAFDFCANISGSLENERRRPRGGFVRSLNIIKLGAEALHVPQEHKAPGSGSRCKIHAQRPEKKGESQLAKAFCDALTLSCRQRRTKAAAISTDNPQGFVADESEWEQTFPQGTQKGDDYMYNVTNRTDGWIDADA